MGRLFRSNTDAGRGTQPTQVVEPVNSLRGRGYCFATGRGNYITTHYKWQTRMISKINFALDRTHPLARDCSCEFAVLPYYSSAKHVFATAVCILQMLAAAEHWGNAGESFNDDEGRSFLPSRLSALVAGWVRPKELLQNAGGATQK